MPPKERARETIDELLRHAGWDVQDRAAMNLFDPNARSVTVRETFLKTGYADHLLFVDGRALAVIEAKKEVDEALQAVARLLDLLPRIQLPDMASEA